MISSFAATAHIHRIPVFVLTLFNTHSARSNLIILDNQFCPKECFYFFTILPCITCSRTLDHCSIVNFPPLFKTTSSTSFSSQDSLSFLTAYSLQTHTRTGFLLSPCIHRRHLFVRTHTLHTHAQFLPLLSSATICL